VENVQRGYGEKPAIGYSGNENSFLIFGATSMSSHYSVDLELMGMLYAIYLTGKWHGVSM
jgi:hypothetical protein